MQALPLRAIITAVGAALALMAAAVIGLYVFRDRAPKSAPAASGLQIVQGAADSRTAATKPLRCFVNGQFVGMATVADCAQKNGVAAQALDVGLDPATGAVEGAGNSLAPPVQAPAPTTPAPTADAQADAAPTPAPPAVAECLRYGPEGWRGAGSDLSLGPGPVRRTLQPTWGGALWPLGIPDPAPCAGSGRHFPGQSQLPAAGPAKS
jgi:hypothetical protein